MSKQQEETVGAAQSISATCKGYIYRLYEIQTYQGLSTTDKASPKLIYIYINIYILLHHQLVYSVTHIVYTFYSFKGHIHVRKR